MPRVVVGGGTWIALTHVQLTEFSKLASVCKAKNWASEVGSWGFLAERAALLPVVLVGYDSNVAFAKRTMACHFAQTGP